MTNNNTLPSVLQKRPSGFLKFFLKVPVYLHRMGLGGREWMIGARWMFITTIGRKTGKKRYTMVNVIEHDLLAGCCSWPSNRKGIRSDDFQTQTARVASPLDLSDWAVFPK